MLLQAQPATTEACTSATALSDSALDDWLEHNSAQAVLKNQARHSPTSTAAEPATDAVVPATAAVASAAVTGTAAFERSCVTPLINASAEITRQRHALLLEQGRQATAGADHSSMQGGTTEATPMQVEADNALLGASAADAEAWFDSFDISQQEQSGECSGATAGIGRGRESCWGPPAPAQFAAMLRGTFAQAVLGGIAGKSLVNQVSEVSLPQGLVGAECCLVMRPMLS